MIDYGAAIDSVKKSSKSELSSRFFGRLKFLVVFWLVRGEGQKPYIAEVPGPGVEGFREVTDRSNTPDPKRVVDSTKLF